MEKQQAVGFNKEYAKSVSKDEFVKQHAHIKGVDLGKEYDKIVPPKEEVKKEK